ncbi:carbohydrate esterase family 4 protein [Sodiomyces alcalophilus JCM 7366]|uniref:carbohydrate esterase family 4 protein n=1 Tax=Sodiomyces alcalophilus JCM 7366 TaxID=591952 RepID=UPI0039B4E22F
MCLKRSMALVATAAAFVAPIHGSPASLTDPDSTHVSSLQSRQDSRCGTGFGKSCDPGYCCSSAGWCGQGYLYCSAPACQINYGPACDANRRPQGPDTRNVARPKLGSVPYGKPIYRCTRPGDIALTFDDGPFDYTEDLLDKLANLSCTSPAYDAKATFFITGNNLGKGMVNDPDYPWPSLLQRMIDEGHQIAGHTWSHQRLTDLSESQFLNQMHYLETAMADLFGFFPTYMRPPYSACNATCEALLDTLGYHITYFNLDTEGYLRNSPEEIAQSKAIWDAHVEGANPATQSWLHIEHDPVYHAVYSLTDHMLESLVRNGFRAVTVGTCLEDPPENWYRSVSDCGPPQFPPTTDGRCGPNHGHQTCAFEPLDMTCCSWANWCGSTAAHCEVIEVDRPSPVKPRTEYLVYTSHSPILAPTS